MRTIFSKFKRSVRLFLGKHYPKLLVSILYRIAFGKRIDWDDPRTLNEKIHWLKFNSDTSLWTLLADKYRVREYVRQRGCEDLLVNLYGVWTDSSEIDWDSLPDKFVMKSNCSSGDVRICTDKSKIDRQEWEAHFDKAMRDKLGYERGEPHYNAIEPAVIAEELLDISKQPIKTSSLIDYKIWCFNGEPHHIWACFNRRQEDVEVAVFDMDWNYHPEKSIFTKHYKESSDILPKPKSLNMMLESARKLSAGLPQVRVDFYEVDDKAYFGEMTMTGGGAFMDWYSDDFMLEMGDLISLTDK